MLTVAILVSGLVYMWSATRGVRPLLYLAKPGTMALIIFFAALGLNSSPSPVWGKAVLVALLFSVVGDLFLMLPHRFIPGVVAFLIAHLCYIWGLVVGLGVGVAPPDLVTFAVFLAYGGLMHRRVTVAMKEGGHTKLVLPVAVYMTVITAMAWRSVAVLFQPGLPVRGWLIAVGAVLFVISDSLLAWDRFVKPIPWRSALVMGTYYTAQYCFALSVWG